MYKTHERNCLLKSKYSIGHSIQGLTMKLLCICQQKMVKSSIVWLNFFDEVDMLHAKIYYNLYY
jgi:hypothetical protein